MPAAERPPMFFDVPADAGQAFCPCDKSDLYWIITQKGKRMQVDCGVEGARAPSRGATDAERVRFGLTDDEMLPVVGRGVAHFGTCPLADRFRKGKKA